MGLKNCDRCGKVFNAETENQETCKVCLMSTNIELKKVTEYLRKFPLASVMEVIQKTGVNQTQVYSFIKGGSLKMREPIKSFKCSVCGVDIKFGTICASCKGKIRSGINDNKHRRR